MSAGMEKALASFSAESDCHRATHMVGNLTK